MELGSDLKVVILRTRAAAQTFEVEPDQSTRFASRINGSRLNLQRRAFILCLRQAFKRILHGGIGRRTQRRVIQRKLRHGAAAVIGPVVHIDHLQSGIKQFNGGQKTVTVEPIGIQIVRLEIGGGYQTHTIFKQGIEQAMQDHGIGDVRHMKLVKTYQPVFLGDAFGQQVQRVDCAVHAGKFTVDLAHELVKMQPCLALERHGIKKAIHQKTLATPNATVHVDAARDRGAIDQLLERVGALLTVLAPLTRTSLKCLHRTQLRRVRGVTPSEKLGLVDFSDGHRTSVCYTKNSD